MLVAEAVTFDPGVVVLFFLLFFAVVGVALTVVIGGLVAGVRAARDGTRARAATLWGTCLTLEAVGLVVSAATGWWEGAAAFGVVVVSTTLARLVPARRS